MGQGRRKRRRATAGDGAAAAQSGCPSHFVEGLHLGRRRVGENKQGPGWQRPTHRAHLRARGVRGLLTIRKQKHEAIRPQNLHPETQLSFPPCARAPYSAKATTTPRDARRNPATANANRCDRFPKHFPFAFPKPLCFVLEGFGAASEVFFFVPRG